MPAGDKDDLLGTCPACGTTSKTRRAYVGATGRCRCGRTFVLSASSAAPRQNQPRVVPKTPAAQSSRTAPPASTMERPADISDEDPASRARTPARVVPVFCRPEGRLFVAVAVVIITLGVLRWAQSPPSSANGPGHSATTANERTQTSFRGAVEKTMVANRTKAPQDLKESREAVNRFGREAEAQTKMQHQDFARLNEQIKAIYDECDANRTRVSAEFIKEVGLKKGLSMSDEEARRLYENYVAMEKLKP
jgi:hypothetical protein